MSTARRPIAVATTASILVGVRIRGAPTRFGFAPYGTVQPSDADFASLQLRALQKCRFEIGCAIVPL
jgi:hypothetical protein